MIFENAQLSASGLLKLPETKCLLKLGCNVVTIPHTLGSSGSCSIIFWVPRHVHVYNLTYPPRKGPGFLPVLVLARFEAKPSHQNTHLLQLQCDGLISGEPDALEKWKWKGATSMPMRGGTARNCKALGAQ